MNFCFKSPYFKTRINNIHANKNDFIKVNKRKGDGDGGEKGGEEGGEKQRRNMKEGGGKLGKMFMAPYIIKF